MAHGSVQVGDSEHHDSIRIETLTSHRVGRRFISVGHDTDMALSDLCVVAVDHPSLDRDVELFLDDLRSEQRYSGPTARTGPKPFSSLIESLRRRTGFRLGVVECGRLVGLARVDRAGQLFIAVLPEHRGRGIATLLGKAVLERATQLGYRRISIRSTTRSRACHGVGAALGCTIRVGAHGRTDLIVDLHESARTV